MATVPSTIQGDFYFNGNLSSKTMTIPDASVTEAKVVTPSAGGEIGAEKLEHIHIAGFAQESGTNAVDEIRVVHVVRATTATLLEFSCGHVTTGATDTVDMDVLVNGTTAMSGGPVRVDDADAAYAILTGTLTTTALVVDDVIEIKIDFTTAAGTPPKGLFGFAQIQEGTL